jgi:hypothetical protein
MGGTFAPTLLRPEKTGCYCELILSSLETTTEQFLYSEKQKYLLLALWDQLTTP